MSLESRIRDVVLAIAFDIKSLFWGLGQKANIENPTFAGQVLMPEGSLTRPGLAFDNDGAPDTGFVHLSDGIFSAVSNTQEVMRFQSNSVLSLVQQVTTVVDTHRMIQGNYGTFWRNDGNALYLMVTAAGDQWGSWTGQRPLIVNLATGIAYINGNAATASKLASPVNINGVPFDGANSINVPIVGGDVTQQIRPKSYGGLAADNLASTLQVEAASSDPGDAAYMIFHRPGQFAAGFGLDVNNRWSVGGWSHGPISYAIYHEGFKPGKADVGLPNVDNTADASKPVSATQQAAIDSKALEDRQNMLPNGGLQLGMLGWVTSTPMGVGQSAYWGASATAAGLGLGVYVANSPVMECAPSTQYTVSGDTLLLGAGVKGYTYLDFEVYDASGTIVQDSSETTISGAHDFNDSPHRRNEHKLTTTTPLTASTMRVRFVAQITAADTITSGIIGFRRIKVERGSQVSGWSDEATLRLLQEQMNGRLSGNISLAIGSDLNTVTAPGLYRLNTAINLPPTAGSGYGQLIVSKGSNTLTQILSNHENGDLFSRSATGDTAEGPWYWTPWGALIYARHLKTVDGQSLLGSGDLAVSFAETTSRFKDNQIDASQTIDLAAGGSKEFANFSGLLIVTDISGGAMRMHMCGGSASTVIGSHGAMQDFPVEHSSAINGYTVGNSAAGARTISIVAIRTHTGS